MGETAYGLKYSQLKDVRDRVVDNTTIQGEGVPTSQVKAKLGQTYFDTINKILYVCTNSGDYTEWKTVDSSELRTYGAIQFYSEWKFGVSEDRAENCIINSIDEDKLMEFLGGDIPEWGINFWYEEGWDEETGEPTGEYYWVWEDTLIYPEEMLATTGIDVEIEDPEEPWAMFDLVAKVSVDETSKIEIGYVRGFDALKSLCFNSSEAFTGETIFVYDAKQEKEVLMSIPAKAITTASLSGAVDEKTGLNITTPSSFLSYCDLLTTVKLYYFNFGDGTLMNCPSLHNVSTNSVRSIGNNFMSACTSFKNEIFLDSVEKIGNYFMNNCSSFNRQVSLPKCKEVGDNFLAYCSNFNNVINAPKLTSVGGSFLGFCTSFNQVLSTAGFNYIGNSFLQGCTSFNQTLNFSDSAILLPAYFLYGCVSFNQDIKLPQLDVSNKSAIGFMQNCHNMSSVVNLGDNSVGALPSTTYQRNTWFATSNSSSAAYQTGITLKGEYVDNWIASLPNNASNPFRKLINGGGGEVSITVDDHLDNASENPVQNKVITTSLGKAKVLTSDDVNWNSSTKTTTNPNAIALWLLPAGIYTISPSGGVSSITWVNNRLSAASSEVGQKSLFIVGEQYDVTIVKSLANYSTTGSIKTYVASGTSGANSAQHQYLEMGDASPMFSSSNKLTTFSDVGGMVDSSVGLLDNLKTTAKRNCVVAINELFDSIDELSASIDGVEDTLHNLNSGTGV